MLWNYLAISNTKTLLIPSEAEQKQMLSKQRSCSKKNDKTNFSKKSHFLKNVSRSNTTYIRKSWDLHCVFIVQVGMRFCKKNFLKMTSICKGIS